MNQRQLIILVLLLGLFVGAALIQKMQSRPDTAREIYEPVPVEVAPEGISEIVIAGGGGRVRIRSNGDDWVLPGQGDIRARSWKVEYLISTFSNLSGELRASSKELFADFGLSDDAAFKVAFLDSRSREDEAFHVSSGSEPGEGSFFRKGGSEEVYWTRLDLVSALGVFGDSPDEDFWADLSLIRTPPEAVERIEIVKNLDGRFVTTVDLKRGWDSGNGERPWVASLNEELDNRLSQTKIDVFLDRLSDINAVRWTEAGREEDSLNDFLKLTLHAGEGEEVVRITGPVVGEDATRYYASLASGMYELAEFNVNRMDIKLDSLLEDIEEEEEKEEKR